MVDEVYLLQDDCVRSLSSTRAKVLTVGLLEAFGGLALSYSIVAPGVVATTAGKWRRLLVIYVNTVEVDEVWGALRLFSSAVWIRNN